MASIECGIDIARLYKYHCQDYNSKIIKKIPLSRISATVLYNKHKNIFDKTSFIFNKYKIDGNSYIFWFLKNVGKNIDKLISADSIKKYIFYKKLIKQYKSIYESFVSTAKYIAEKCRDEGYSSSIDYLKDIISDSTKLGALFLSGKISEYWLSAVPNISEIIQVSDKMVIETFNGFDFLKLYADIQKVFIYFKNIRVDSIKYTDAMI